jgi:hypothetical protein
METLTQLIADHPVRLSALVAMLALGVSFLSVLLTVASLYIQRQHNYKSVTPIARIAILDYEHKVAVRVKNNGIGPLIVDAFRVTDGDVVKNDLISWMPALPDTVSWDTFFDNLDGASIPAGEQVTVLQLSGDPNDKQFVRGRDSCRKALSALTISLTYRDIYSCRMPEAKKRLRWFGRHFIRTH